MAAFRWAWTLAVVVCLSACAMGFLEEECFVDGQATNLFSTASSLNCSYGELTPRCALAAVYDGSAVFGETTPCRSFVHFDSVFFIAQAVGFTGEMAYWISTFSQAVDFVQYAPVDSCGELLEQRLWTPPMRGFLRTSTFTGQYVRHIGLISALGEATRPSDLNALSPNLTDYEFEGMLATARAWAFGETNLYCTMGITEPENGNYFKGDRCMTSTFVDNTTPEQVQGLIPAPAVDSITLGDQIMHYNCIGDPQCANPPFNLTDVLYAYEFEDYLKNGTWSKLNNGDAVPELIARFGVYLHQRLADRHSHYYCTNSNKTAVLGPRSSDGAFYVEWDIVECQWVYHGIQHYWEQGVEGPLAPQTWAALNYLFDEIQAFATKFTSSHPEWFTNAARLSKDVVVGTTNEPGILPTLASEEDVVARVDSFREYLRQYGYEQVPGHEAACGSQSSAAQLTSVFSAFM